MMLWNNDQQNLKTVQDDFVNNDKKHNESFIEHWSTDMFWCVQIEQSTR